MTPEVLSAITQRILGAFGMLDPAARLVGTPATKINFEQLVLDARTLLAAYVQLARDAECLRRLVIRRDAEIHELMQRVRAMSAYQAPIQ